MKTDHGTLVADWRATADRAGFDADARLALVREAEARAANGLHLPDPSIADRAVAHAADKLGERLSVFSVAALREEAGRVGLGKVGYTEIGEAIARATKEGELVDRTFLDRRGAAFAGFTTHQNIAAEKTLLRIEAHGRGAFAPIASQLTAAKAVEGAAAKSERSGFAWNSDQKAATKQLLTSRNRIASCAPFAAARRTASARPGAKLWSGSSAFGRRSRSGQGSLCG